MENKELLEKGLAVLVSRLESTEAFVVEQAPEICKQMIYQKIIDNSFECAESSFWMVAGIIGFAFAIHFFNGGGVDIYGGWDVQKILSFLATFASIGSFIGGLLIVFLI
jgi:hypothetical protein